jgi:argininosuccinate lyase
MASVGTRAFSKLLEKMPESRDKICSTLLEVEEEALKDAEEALRDRDYRKAHEITGELYDAIDQWETLGGCSRERKMATPKLVITPGVG